MLINNVPSPRLGVLQRDGGGLPADLVSHSISISSLFRYLGIGPVSVVTQLMKIFAFIVDGVPTERSYSAIVLLTSNQALISLSLSQNNNVTDGHSFNEHRQQNADDSHQISLPCHSNAMAILPRL